MSIIGTADLSIKISENNAKLSKNNVTKLLLVYDLNRFFIGDTCINISRIKKVQAFYNNALIDINTVNRKHHGLIGSIMLNNPYIADFSNLSWDEIDFESYDVVICASLPELEFLEFISKKYGTKILNGSFLTRIYSAAGCIGFEDQYEAVLPKNVDFIDYSIPAHETSVMMANQLFVSEKEREWSDNWLAEQGMEVDENLIILLDSSSAREKMLKIDVHFDMLNWFLKTKKNKVLVFDEEAIGKKHFYIEWIGGKLGRQMIFAEGMSLRDAIGLMSSRFTKMIFGPSTGLLHCASGIFSVFAEQGMPVSQIPLMIGCIGKVEADYHEDLWWRESLVDGILVVQDEMNNTTIKSIKEVDYPGLSKLGLVLNCQRFTSDQIIGYINSRHARAFL